MSLASGKFEQTSLAMILVQGTTGPKVEKFTGAFADYVGGRFAVPVSSATAGLHVALLALGVGPGAAQHAACRGRSTAGLWP